MFVDASALTGVLAIYRGVGFEDLPYDPARSKTMRIKDLIHNGFTC